MKRRVIPTLDYRTLEQCQRYDEIVERRYNLRVAANPKDRARLKRQRAQVIEWPELLRRRAG